MKVVIVYMNIFMILLNFLMLTINFFVGNNLVEPVHIFIILSILLTIIYLIVNRNKIVFFENKLDIFVFIFMLLPILPMIFRSSISLNYNYNYLQENISI